MKFLKNQRNSGNTRKNLLTAFRWLGVSLPVAESCTLVYGDVTPFLNCGCVEIWCSKLVWLCLVMILGEGSEI